MTTRTPLSLSRLTTPQMLLAAVTLLLLAAVVAMSVLTLQNTSAAQKAFESSYVITDLANVEQSIYRLHLATDEALADYRTVQFEELQLRLGLLESQMHMSVGEAAAHPSVATALGALRRQAAAYRAIITDLQRELTAGQLAAARESLAALLGRMEATALATYDREEARYLAELNHALGAQRVSQVALLAMSALLIIFGLGLVLSLRRSVGQEFERAYAMLESLYRADEHLHRGVRSDEVFQALVDVAVDQFGADKSVLMVWDADSDSLVARAARGMHEATLAHMRFGLDAGSLGESARMARTVEIGDTANEMGALRPIVVAEAIRACMHVPVMVGEQVYGVLSVCYTQPRTFDRDDRRLIEALAHRAASAIQTARLYEGAQEAATIEERQRLARELHDAVTQTLFSASLIAEVLPRLWERSAEQGRLRLEELRQLTRGALAEMRTLLVELRPAALVDTSLEELLPQLVEAIVGRSRVPTSLTIDGRCRLDPPVKVALYRIAQEALNNMAKHSGASQAEVRLDCRDGGATLVVRDNGCGFGPDPVAPNHLGLGIMRERAQAVGASLTVESAPEQGTLVKVTWLPAQVEE